MVMVRAGVTFNLQRLPVPLSLEESIQVSGAPSAYFPKDQDCQTTKSNTQLQENIIEIFTMELKNQSIQEQPQQTCLVCGRS